jgi:tryptophan synthase alpha chain
MSKFVSFITAGDPSFEKTREFIDVLADYSEIIEVGLPFSDPIAEGAVIGAANMRALENGATTDGLFAMLEQVNFKKMVILTYINPVFKYGVERFFSRCKESGVWGVIIPDLPYEERGEVAEFADKFGIHLITLIAPTSADRVKMLAEKATGFIYLVSSMGTTGMRNELEIDLTKIIAQIREVTDVPIMVGFGISTSKQVREICKIADGAIVGSAFVKIIEEHKDKSAPYLREFIKAMTEGV